MKQEFYEAADHPVWCSQCERWDEDCVCEEICDHFNSIKPISPTDSVNNGAVTAESNKQPVPSCSGTGTLLLRYPVWDMTFSAYGEQNGWEIPQ